MYIKAREREIIDILLAQPQGVTLIEIAQRLGLSTRTIQREILGIEKILAIFSISLLKSSQTGLCLMGSPQNISQLRHELSAGAVEYTAAERQELLICNILKHKQVSKLTDLAELLNVTTLTITADLNKIEETLVPFSLNLVRKKGHGILIEGDESKKRRLLADIVAGNMNEYELLNNQIPERLGVILESEPFAISAEIIRHIEGAYRFSFVEMSYKMLCIYLSIMVGRVWSGQLVQFEKNLLESLKTSKKYDIAKDIATALTTKLDLKLPENEIGYLIMCLQTARFKQGIVPREEYKELEVKIATKALIFYVSEHMSIAFTEDTTLVANLENHIYPSIHRIEKELTLPNPLEKEIVEKYPILSKHIGDALAILFADITFPKGEIAHITLYFASYLELFTNERGFSALVVCTNGMGYSKMLSSRLKKEIKEIKHIENIALSDLQHKDKSDYDLILSTTPIPDTELAYILVSPLLSEPEVQSIKAVLKDYRILEEDKLIKRNAIKRVLPDVDIENIEKIQATSRVMLTILKRFDVVQMAASYDTLVEECYRLLLTNEVVSKGEDIYTKFEKGHESGYFGIPSTQLGLYHCKSHEAKQPFVQVVVLDDPIHMQALDLSPIALQTIFVMVVPDDITPDENEVVSGISEMMIELKDKKILKQPEKTALKKEITAIFYKQLQQTLGRKHNG